jgi:hypothetical protein
MRPLLLLLLAAATAPAAHAYCVVNELKARDAVVVQGEHPDPNRHDRRFQHTLKPGERQCCDFHNLDCNPLGRNASVVNLAISIPGEPAYECRPENGPPAVKVTGAGTITITNTTREKSAYPFIVRIRANDGKDLTGPRGIACLEAKPKGK